MDSHLDYLVDSHYKQGDLLQDDTFDYREDIDKEIVEVHFDVGSFPVDSCHLVELQVVVGSVQVVLLGQRVLDHVDFDLVVNHFALSLVAVVYHFGLVVLVPDFDLVVLVAGLVGPSAED